MREKFKEEEIRLWQRRENLKRFLEAEEEAFIQELATRQEMEQCGYCTEKNEQIKKYLEDMEKQKIDACLKALEREKMWVVFVIIISLLQLGNPDRDKRSTTILSIQNVECILISSIKNYGSFQ